MTTMSESQHLQDGIAGVTLSLLGAAAVYFSMSYRGASGIYPGILGCVLAIFGAILAIRARRRSGQVSPARPLTNSPVHLLVTLALTTAYLAIIPVLGFYTSSAIVLLVVPLALGLRRPLMLVLCMAISITIIYAIFALLVKRPLPTEFFLTY